MNIFANREPIREAEPQVRPSLAARISAMADEYNAGQFFAGLQQVLTAADTLADEAWACRQCGRCCDQDVRHLAVYAIEAANMLRACSTAELLLNRKSETVCPGLAKTNLCHLYEGRPIGCRLFLPWRQWTSQRGCANYPYRSESRRQMHDLLMRLEGINQAFVWKLGLHRDFDFDFLGQWSVLEWFDHPA